MSEGLKRILIIGGFALSVVVIATVLYLMFFKPAPPAPLTVVEQEKLTDDSKLPSSGEGRGETTAPTIREERLQLADEIARGGRTITNTLTNSLIEAPTLSQDGNINFYDPNDGKFYHITADGTFSRLSEQSFPNVEQVSWNENGDKAVLEFPDGSNIVYNFEAKTQTTLPKHWEDFSFSPVKDEILAKSIGLDIDNRWLVITNADGSNTKTIQALGDNADKVTVNWSPNDQVVAFADTADPISGSADRHMILPLGKNQENYKGLIIEGNNFESKWSPDGTKILYSTFSEYSSNKPLLWISDGTPGSMGENRHSLGINTWVEKCAFSSQNILYCAVPKNLPPNSGLQKNYFRDLADDVYRIDLATGRSALIAIPDIDTPMQNLSIDKNETTIFYTNGATGKLETIKLK